MNNLNKKMERLKEKIQDEDFLSGKGLSNEVNIRIFTYDPEDEMKVRYFIEKLENDESLKCNIISKNLFHIFLEICEESELMEGIEEIEKEEGSKLLLGELKDSIDDREYIQKLDYENHQTGDVLLLSGVGEVFPFLRMHTLLEAMQSTFSDIVVIVMYPGTFDGISLSLFNEFEKTPYYRAFNLI